MQCGQERSDREELLGVEMEEIKESGRRWGGEGRHQVPMAWSQGKLVPQHHEELPPAPVYSPRGSFGERPVMPNSTYHVIMTTLVIFLIFLMGLMCCLLVIVFILLSRHF